MTREEIIRNLKYMMKKHKNDTVHTFDTNISVMCKDILDYLEQEQKTGHWILTIEDWNKWTCSECGFYRRTDIHVYLGYNYCPECGVKMVEPQESEGAE